MQLCALVIGHKKTAQGAVNKASGLTEWVFNDGLSKRIESMVDSCDIIRIHRDGYSNLPNKINSYRPDFIISLHCNAFNTKATGTEVLYYYKSNKGMNMAIILQFNIVRVLNLPDRGIKPKTTEDRGGYLLRYTTAPCVIAEPFFIDNDYDLSMAQNNMDGLAQAYADGIDEIVNRII